MFSSWSLVVLVNHTALSCGNVPQVVGIQEPSPLSSRGAEGAPKLPHAQSRDREPGLKGKGAALLSTGST